MGKGRSSSEGHHPYLNRIQLLNAAGSLLGQLFLHLLKIKDLLAELLDEVIFLKLALVVLRVDQLNCVLRFLDLCFLTFNRFLEF